MGRRRPSVPAQVEARLLFGNDHTCCVCRTPLKDVQIHHIDSDPANNDLANLAVVCLDCHSRITGSRGLGRSFKPEEVLLYKEAWEQHVRQLREPPKPDVPYKNELVSQIDLMITEILALPEDSERVPVLLDQLNQLYMWRGGPEFVETLDDGLNHLAMMTALGGSKVADLLPDLLWELCWQFVGPDQVPMDNLGRSHVNRCIETLASLASFNARFARRRQLLPAPILTMRNFLDIALRYEDHDVAAALLDGLEATLEAGGEDPVFLPNQHEALATLMWTKEALSESGSAWAPERERLDDLHLRFGLVYFITSSKEGEATFTIEHPLAGQELTLPIVPNDSVPEASALLEPAFAHYARQWHRFAVPDPEETDARGFYLEARFLPGPIALPEKKTELDELATRYLSDSTRRFFGKMLPVPALSHELGFGPYSGNAPDYLTPPDVCGIELLDSSGSNEGDGKEG